MDHEVRSVCGPRMRRSLEHAFNPKVVSQFYLKCDKFDRLARNVDKRVNGNKREVRPGPFSMGLLSAEICRPVNDKSPDTVFGRPGILCVRINECVHVYISFCVSCLSWTQSSFI